MARTPIPSPGNFTAGQAKAEHNRGLAFAQQGQINPAIECFRRAIAMDADLFAAYSNLGTLLAEQALVEEAMAALRKALELKPDSSSVHNNLSNLLASLGQLDAAEEHCRQSLAIAPAQAEAFNALGNVLKDKGQLDEAIAAYSQAALLRPDLPQPASNYLYALHFHPDQNIASLVTAHREWADRFATALKSQRRAPSNDRDPQRRLKIGYVSPDFREHPVGRFILPLLANHDRKHFEIFCYANMRAADSMTQRIRQHADAWRDIAPLSDEQAAELIRSDGIDVLIDLAMHLRANRLFVFALKPAPVQATYLAYCSTTGLDAIDYRLTDPYLETGSEDADKFVERTVRLPRTYWCYQANEAAPQVNPLPALSHGHLTFSCLNNFCKVTPDTLAVWARLLAAIPTARLILHAGEGEHRERSRKMLGISAGRLRFVSRTPMANYFAQYHQIDIALDPFPYTGGTTTCDALWMGVPVVSLAGETPVSRGGLSILSNLGCAQWVAKTADEYVEIAVKLAVNLPALAAIRGSLRQQMERSPLMDEPQFARDIESAYRSMWRRWCSE